MAALDSTITFLGWAALTYVWLHTNMTFAAAILQAIQDHDNAIRIDLVEKIQAKDTDSEPEQSGDES